MSGLFDFLSLVIKLLETHPIIASFLIIILSIYILLRIWNYVTIPNGLMGLTQRNRFIDQCTAFIFFFVLILVINTYAMVHTNKFFSVNRIIEVVNESIEGGLIQDDIPNITKEMEDSIIHIGNAIASCLLMLFITIYLERGINIIHMRELENKFTSFYFYAHVLYFCLVMTSGAIVIAISGVCRDNIMLYLASLSVVQNIILMWFLSDSSLGYAEYKILSGYPDGQNEKRDRKWDYLYAVSDDMQYFECGSELSKRNNSSLKVYNLQEISGKSMKIQPTYAQEFRVYFGRRAWLINKLHLSAKAKGIVIYNPLNVELKYAIIEIRYYKKRPMSIMSLMTKSEYAKEYLKIENWAPRELRELKCRKKKGKYYITLAMVDCETD